MENNVGWTNNSVPPFHKFGVHFVPVLEWSGLGFVLDDVPVVEMRVRGYPYLVLDN